MEHQLKSFQFTKQGGTLSPLFPIFFFLLLFHESLLFSNAILYLKKTGKYSRQVTPCVIGCIGEVSAHPCVIYGRGLLELANDEQTARSGSTDNGGILSGQAMCHKCQLRFHKIKKKLFEHRGVRIICDQQFLLLPQLCFWITFFKLTPLI